MFFPFLGENACSVVFDLVPEGSILVVSKPIYSGNVSISWVLETHPITYTINEY